MFILGVIVGGALFGSAAWFGKEQMQLFYKTGTEIAQALETKAAALRAKL